VAIYRATQQQSSTAIGLDGHNLRLCGFVVAAPPAADVSTMCLARKDHRFVVLLLLATGRHASTASWVPDTERNPGQVDDLRECLVGHGLVSVPLFLDLPLSRSSWRPFCIPLDPVSSDLI
jgi:hypothetical protein